MSVLRWVTSVINDSVRPKVNDMNEMSVKRRLDVKTEELIEKCKLSLKIHLVKSAENWADALTLVSSAWLSRHITCASVRVTTPDVANLKDEIAKLHGMHHLGIEKTFHPAKCNFGGGICKELVGTVVKECAVC